MSRYNGSVSAGKIVAHFVVGNLVKLYSLKNHSEKLNSVYLHKRSFSVMRLPFVCCHVIRLGSCIIVRIYVSVKMTQAH